MNLEKKTYYHIHRKFLLYMFLCQLFYLPRSIIVDFKNTKIQILLDEVSKYFGRKNTKQFKR